MFALPLVPAVSQTKTAKRACLPGRTTEPFRDCTEMHSCALGGGGVVGVVEGEGLGVGVSVAEPDLLGDGEADLLGDGPGDPPPVGEVLVLGFGLGAGEAMGEPGETDGTWLGVAEGLPAGDDLAPLRAAKAVRWIRGGLATATDPTAAGAPVAEQGVSA